MRKADHHPARPCQFSVPSVAKPGEDRCIPKGLSTLIPDSPPSLENLRNVGNIQKWMENPQNTYIGRHCKSYGRASYLQNPFHISSSCSRNDSISKFKMLLERDKEMQSKLPSLANKRLGCWCVPQPCHGETLIHAFMEQPFYEELEAMPAPIFT